MHCYKPLNNKTTATTTSNIKSDHNLITINHPQIVCVVALIEQLNLNNLDRRKREMNSIKH